MKYRKLGSTGIEVSVIGFGTWGIGGDKDGAVAYGPTKDEDSLSALELAHEEGVNFFDTADLYGFGHSEELLGQAFKEVRSEVIIADKAGFLDYHGKQDFTRDHIVRSLEQSLERLQTDYVDLYQLHDPPLDVLSGDDNPLSTLSELKESGMIRAVGVSLCSPDDGLVVVRDYQVDSIQTNLNLADHRVLQNGLLDICQKEEVGVIIRTPLSFGFLTGQHNTESQFASSDHRAKWPKDKIRAWSEAVDRFTGLVSDRDRQTPAQVALRFCMSHDAVSTVIPGMLTVEHVDENVRAGNMGGLQSDEMDRIRQTYEDLGY